MTEGFEQAQLEWADLLMQSFVEAGGREVVISPGSRSTPFVLAATRQSKLQCYDAIDERTAGFFALGMAKVTDRPPLLLCTSGTAGAHYLPAVIEAGMSFTPLLVLTADRPFELQGCQSPQTIDQVKLFGDHARLYLELGIAESTEEARRRLRSAIAQAVFQSRSPLPGAVHLNARARKPLEPTTAQLSTPAVSLPSDGPCAYVPRLAPNEAGVDALARAIMAARRGIIVCGPGPIGSAHARLAVQELAKATRFPVLAEAASQFRFAAPLRATSGENDPVFCDGFDMLLRCSNFGRMEPPDLIVQLGAPPTSTAWEKFISRHPQIERWVIAPYGWNDPLSSARGFLFGGIADTVRAVSSRMQELARRPSREPSDWERMWVESEIAGRRAVEAVLSQAGSSLTEGSVAQLVVRSVPKGSVLAVGNSLPIRLVDAFCFGDSADFFVWSQRGANGIDGLISGATGVAAVGYPTTLLLGDVSFLHDVGGLALAHHLRDPLVVVVLQNDGGRMFEQLPVAQLKSLGPALDHWITPHGRSFEHAARLYDHRYQRVETNEALRSALDEAHQSPGCTIIEAVVPPHGAAEIQRQVQARLEVELESLLRGGPQRGWAPS